MNPFFSAHIPTLRSLLNQQIPTVDQGLSTSSSPAVAHPDTSTEAVADSGLSTEVEGDSSDTADEAPESVVMPLDPLMDVDGLPQSGTGHAALLTGLNAAALFGRHFGPWVPVPLRPLVMGESVLFRAKALGARCAFANAYPSQYHQLAWSKRPAGPPLAAKGAGLLTRHEDHLSTGEAVSSEMVNSAWRERLGFHHVPEISVGEAGRNLAHIAKGAQLTLFAHYGTDTAGHERKMPPAVAALERVDRFLEGLLTELSPETLLIIASDHGNIEDITQGHTRNPILVLLNGPGARKLSMGPTSITDVAGLILGALSLQVP